MVALRRQISRLIETFYRTSRAQNDVSPAFLALHFATMLRILTKHDQRKLVIERQKVS